LRIGLSRETTSDMAILAISPRAIRSAAGDRDDFRDALNPHLPLARIAFILAATSTAARGAGLPTVVRIPGKGNGAADWS
jgi:hypothetical protein